MKGWTRGCQDKEGARGQTAASRHLSWNHRTSTTQQQGKRNLRMKKKRKRSTSPTSWGRIASWMAKKISCPTKSGVHNTDLTLKLQSFSHNESTAWSKQRHHLISNESCSPRSCDVCHHPKHNQIDQCFSCSEWPLTLQSPFLPFY